MTAVTAVASPPRVRIGGFSLRERGTGATVLIAAVATAFAVVLLSATAFLSASISATPHVGESRTFAVVSGILTSLLVGVAVYVASIVTANTFATVVAGRVRQIALLRLLGSTARSQRRDVARLGLVAGIVGAVAGLVGGTVLSFAGVWVLENAYGIAAPGLELIRPVLLVPRRWSRSPRGPARGRARVGCCGSRRWPRSDRRSRHPLRSCRARTAARSPRSCSGRRV
ncbi:FtsX-like permease family protein [Microbacterium ginsengisoli]|uniref:FtsX-like permease family protein n=1 Tax=Microbacterium ginsengisoli TaxID=400772 RepID=A0A0F0LWT0_9MICO|nr:FtsX-like permease family protein [Microbacterium ginsengisoli]KJL36745.1 FtsX-like permease family protein [Microbacterium ginsengisoli]